MTGHLIGVTGIPGTGKSYFARSARMLGKTAIALCDPKEASFYGEEGVTVFSDLDWRPHLKQYNANALVKLLAWLDARGKDDTKFVVIDPFSEVSDLAMHEVLKMHSTNDPSDVEYGRAYTGHDQQIKTVITELRRLVVAGKTVICTFHGQMKELEGAGAAKKAKDMSGKKDVWQFDEQMLPAMGTSIRQRIHSPFDLWLYTLPIGFGAGRKYFVTAVADFVRPAKHSVTFRAGTNPALIANTMQALFNSLAPETAPTPETPAP